MLYESTGGVGRIIGLKPRKNSDGLVCIITQDLTILTEQEYDIILYGKLFVFFRPYYYTRYSVFVHLYLKTENSLNIFVLW